jgi:hypothetical protein
MSPNGVPAQTGCPGFEWNHNSHKQIHQPAADSLRYANPINTCAWKQYRQHQPIHNQFLSYCVDILLILALYPLLVKKWAPHSPPRISSPPLSSTYKSRAPRSSSSSQLEPLSKHRNHFTGTRSSARHQFIFLSLF